MTRRIIHACENPNVSIIGHPPRGSSAGAHRRRLGRLFAACACTGIALEIDAFPDRLDLPADLIRLALRHGAVFVVDSDSRHPAPRAPSLRGRDRPTGLARRTK